MANENQFVENVLTEEKSEQEESGTIKEGENLEEVIPSESAVENPETNFASTDSSENKKEELPSWAFSKMNKKIEREVAKATERAVTVAVQNLLQTQYQMPLTQNAQESPPVNYGYQQQPLAQKPNMQAELDNYFAQKRQQDLVLKEAEKAKVFNVQVESARDKFDDYDDFVSEAGQHFTQPMYALMTDLPNSVENFKLAWDEDKNRIMNISKLSPTLQIAELKQVLDDVQSRKASQKYKPTTSKPISPVRSTSNDVVKDSNSFTDLVRNRYRKPSR